MARAIQVAVRLGLPDLLANRPRELSELALATASDEPTLYRFLRCLKHLGIIMETSPKLYSSTLLSQRLKRDGAGRERTKDEFVSLLRGSSYKLHRVIATATPISIIEALPV